MCFCPRSPCTTWIRSTSSGRISWIKRGKTSNRTQTPTAIFNLISPPSRLHGRHHEPPVILINEIRLMTLYWNCLSPVDRNKIDEVRKVFWLGAGPKTEDRSRDKVHWHERPCHMSKQTNWIHCNGNERRMERRERETKRSWDYFAGYLLHAWLVTCGPLVNTQIVRRERERVHGREFTVVGNHNARTTSVCENKAIGWCLLISFALKHS